MAVRTSKITSGRAAGNKLKQIKIKKPHDKGQREIYEHPARFQVVACGRRFGKTEVGKIICSKELSLPNRKVGWISPTTKMASEVWRSFLEIFGPICVKELGGWQSVQEKTLILPNKSKISFWTAENEDAIRGQEFHLVVMDEAAMYKSANLWQSIVRATLSQTKGRAYFLSTPRGRNWFYDLYQLGDPLNSHYDTSGEHKSWCFPSINAPGMTQDELDKIRKAVPERFYRQEYLAEFLIDSGEVFKGVTRVSIGDYYEEPYAGDFVFGVDLARKNDYTVIQVLDMNNLRQVDSLVINSMSYPEQRRELYGLWQKWKPLTVLVETNKGGDAFVDDLREQYPEIQVEGFFTSESSKKEIIDRLAIKIQNEDIILLNDRDQVAELQAYEMKLTPSGKIKFDAPYGMHDDRVMSLAIALEAVEISGGSFGAAIPA